MIHSILLPLDGSSLAEAGIAPAAAFAKHFGATLTLLHVVERDAPREVHGDRHLTAAKEASAYLESIASRLRKDDIKVLVHVHAESIDDVSDAIVSHASREFDPDLIVICAHGGNRLRDFVFGSLGQKVIAAGRTPVLLVHAEAAAGAATAAVAGAAAGTATKDPVFAGVEGPYDFRHLLVPIDSDSAHDESLPWAVAVARAFDSEIRLLTVVHTVSTLSGHSAAVKTMSPLATSALLEMKGAEAEKHLQEHLDELGADNLKVKAELARGAPAKVIAAAAQRHKPDMIILASHSKVGMKAFWSGSVACEVLRKTKRPVLLIPLRA